MAPSTGRDESRVAEFVEHFGAFLTHSGLPPIASRVWVLLLADDDGRMTAREIGEALGISPAAVSTATSYLAQLGFTKRLREPGSRRVVHALVSDDWYEDLVTRKETMVTLRDLALAGAEAAGGTATRAGRRLWLSAEMNDFILAAIGEAMTTWPQRKQELLGGLAGLHP